MTILRILGSAVVMAVAASAGGCDEGADLTGPTPGLTPTFSSIQSEIFESSGPSGRPDCVSCHNTQLAQLNGGLDLSHNAAYASLVNVRSTGSPTRIRVIPGDADGSYLIHKLEGRAGIVGQRMPISGPYLTAGQIDVIEQWIALGARND